MTKGTFAAILFLASLAILGGLAGCSESTMTEERTTYAAFTDPETGCRYFVSQRRDFYPRLRADGTVDCPDAPAAADNKDTY